MQLYLVNVILPRSRTPSDNSYGQFLCSFLLSTSPSYSPALLLSSSHLCPDYHSGCPPRMTARLYAAWTTIAFP